MFYMGCPKGTIAWNKGTKGVMKANKTSFTKDTKAFKGRHHSEETKKKLSEANKGKNIGNTNGFKKGQVAWNKGLTNLPPSWNKGTKGVMKANKTSFKVGEMLGEKSHNWLGGKSFEPYDKAFNNKFRRAIRKRDNQICMLCNIHREKLKRALCVHHIDYDKLLTIPQNCISLCTSCHGKTGVNRNHWTNFFQALLTEKYNYVYEENKIKLEI